ncbi:MAG: twin-arginine translocation pathway signal [Proteobacteria bacterium]|nr:twin-arginine translocation pathway signal [Pseudomonadota bacterium]
MSPTRVLAASIVSLSLIAAGCTTTNPQSNPTSAPETRTSIDANVDAALQKLYAQAPDAQTMVRKARGVLVFPSVVSAGFVVGGSYGKGALRVGGRTQGYYSTTAASVGLLAGADSKAVYILFMTDAALEKFRNSEGWTAGADASVSVLKAGAAANADTQTVQQAVVGYVLTNAGLMANLAIDGTKVTRLMI